MMVPQPSRTLDLQRKEELILQKQIRQSTCKVNKSNLPTLIEASPDFNSKKLPYLPYLPDSVQSLAYDDTTESIVTDDLPSLYSVPHKFRSESRCSSITFDLTDAEGYNRHRSKSRNKKQKERKENKEESQANIFAREEEEMVPVARESFKDQAREDPVEESYLSKWSCRRCTLENPLTEAVCLACGGSRLSSIGDIEVPRLVEPKNLVQMIREEEEEEVEAKLMKWKCGVCTLENEPLNYFCDACNSPNPRQEARKNKTKEEVVTRADDPNSSLGLLLSQAIRYLGIACFCLIFLLAIFNMITSICHSLNSLLNPVQTQASQALTSMDSLHSVNDINEEDEKRESIEGDNDNALVVAETNERYAGVILVTDESQLGETNDAEEAANNSANVYIYQIFFETLGIVPMMFAIYWPLFLYLSSKICKVGREVTQAEPRVPQPL